MNETIEKLIASGKEGSWWDFKQTYHQNNAALVHDILCMANTLHDVISSLKTVNAFRQVLTPNRSQTAGIRHRINALYSSRLEVPPALAKCRTSCSGRPRNAC